MRRTAIAAAVLSLTFAVAAFPSAVASKSSATAPLQGRVQPAIQSAPPREWGEIAAHLAVIDSTVARLSQRPEKSDLWSVLMPAVIGLVGVLVGGVINFFAQRSLSEGAAKNDLELAEARAKVEFGNAFVQWQLKQLAELYGPLHALLQQSNTLYRDMNNVLEKHPSGRFKTLPAAPGDPDYLDNKVFKIKVGDDWVPFRTIMHLQEVYGKEYGVEPYFDEIVSIGGQIEKVIREKAGYARPEELELSTVFGKYLAHYSVLTQLHAALKDRTKKIPVDQWAVFPNEIQGLVATGFNAISDDLKKWRARTQ
jgi:hypothetical protein